MKYNDITKSLVTSLSVLAISLAGCDATTVGKEHQTTQSQAAGLVTFDQGWSRDEALDFYNTSQGSHLIPYSWFLALEQADKKILFRDNQNMARFGYIAQAVLAGRNPEGLPIGFAKDDIPEPFLAKALNRARIPPGGSGVQTAYNEWLGLTCAACHTSEINYKAHTLRIDGGPSLTDMQTFMKEMSVALTATSNDEAKLTRFSKNILAQGGDSAAEKESIKTQLKQYLGWLNNYNSINYDNIPAPYGYGRLDAFGAILNRVTASLLDIPANGTPANAPVSFPYLWNTSQLDWVQWNGSIDNHIGRNMGEVSGVFAHTILNTDNDKERFYSSGKIINLDQLESYMSKLDSPKWGLPLPPLDQGKVEKGKALFAQNCLSCHGVRDESGQFPMTPANRFGKQFIKITMTALNDIGTDPQMAMNFVNPALNVDPGPMRPYLEEEYKDKDKVPRAVILTAAVGNIIKKQVSEFTPPLDNQQLLELSGYRDPANSPPNLVAYKARPLNGIWATAPYMHNGSMASLHETLLPEEQRASSFYVGNGDFDPVKVGFNSTTQGNHSLFETVDKDGKAIGGNSNKGHAGDGYTKTRDKNGQWRDFSDAERYQLIEYMKSL